MLHLESLSGLPSHLMKLTKSFVSEVSHYLQANAREKAELEVMQRKEEQRNAEEQEVPACCP